MRLEVIKLDAAEIATQILHDIKAPLMTLKILSHRLMELHPDNEDRILLAKAIGRLESLAEVRHELSPENFNFLNMIKDLAEQFEATYPTIKIKIESIGAEHIWTVGKAEFERVCSNIIQNSIDAAIAPMTIEIKVDSNNKKIKFKDNGPGIPHNIINNLFKAPIQSRKIGGQGIGLFGSKKLLFSLGFDLVLVSEVGAGTTVSIEKT